MTTKHAMPRAPKEKLVMEGTVEIIVEKQTRTKDKECTRQKASQVRKPTSNNSETLKNWGCLFANQNVEYMKRMQSKSTKNVESKEAPKKSFVSHAQEQRKKESHMYYNKCSNGTSSKRISPQKKSDFKTLCHGKPSSVNNIPSIIVQDRVVQCKICDCLMGKFGEYNLSSETVVIRSALEEQMSKLMESSEMMKTIHESWSFERKNLQSMIQEQDILLKKAEKKQISLQDNVKMLEQQLEETTQAMEAKDETISKLKQQIKSNETAEKIISNLRTDLAEQTEIAHNMHIKNQCLTIEKEKLSVLLSYKDTLITDYQDIKNEFIKGLQDTTKQLITSNEAYVNEGNACSQFSVIQTGPVCSSPNSSSSDLHFNNPLSCNESNISLSTVEHVLQERVKQKQDAAVTDSMRFVSLLDGESSHTLIADSYKNHVINDRETIARCHNTDIDNTVRYRNDHNKENDTKKFSRSKRKLGGSTKSSSYRNSSSKILAGAESKPASNAEKLDMLDDVQNRIPVDVPSPLREYPRPDWSDSSLSSISTPSDLDIVPSNDI